MPKDSYIEFPIDHSYLRSISNQCWKENWTDIGYTIEWLCQKHSSQAVLKEIAQSWSCSFQPFITLADFIRQIKIEMSGFHIAIDVLVPQSPYASIQQQAPMQREQLDSSIADIEQNTKQIIREFCCAVPGLCLNDSGCLLHPSFLQHPMQMTRPWIDSGRKWEHEWTDRGLRFPSVDDYIIELFVTPLRDFYVLGRDHAIHFFRKDELEFVQLKIDLRTLVMTYLQSPELLLNPYELAWIATG